MRLIKHLISLLYFSDLQNLDYIDLDLLNIKLNTYFSAIFTFHSLAVEVFCRRNPSDFKSDFEPGRKSEAEEITERARVRNLFELDFFRFILFRH